MYLLPFFSLELCLLHISFLLLLLKMWEDEYDPTDRKFTCKVDRTSGPLQPSQQLNLINHNLNVDLMPIGRGIRLPDRLNSPRTNSIHSYVNLLYHFFFLLFSRMKKKKKKPVYWRENVLCLIRITAHANHCAPLAGDQFPNFVLLDFVNVNIAQAMKAVDQLNGFSY